MLSVGIVGLPNVGKSTLFNSLNGGKQADAENYPFCTVEPNVGVVEVPDSRLEQIAEISNPKEVTPTAIEFVDIAGLVEGASEGEGMGNQFLANIREVDAIAQVVRDFESSDISHVEGRVDPHKDADIINLELIMADLETVSKRLEKTKKETKGGADKDTKKELNLLEKLYDQLESGQPARNLNLDEKEQKIIKELHLLSMKPMMYIVNVDEDDLMNDEIISIEDDAKHIKVSAKLEEEMLELPKEKRAEYLSEFGMDQTGLDKIISAGYDLLNLITFFTTGEKETRAWAVEQNTPADKAAGTIHSDFEQGFVKAEVVDWKKFVELGGWSEAKEEGTVKLAGDDYIVTDGDICHFHTDT